MRATEVHDRMFVPDEEAPTTDHDFYVTVIHGERSGFLLGPYLTHAEALAQVFRGKKLAEQHNTRALFNDYAYGTASAPSASPIETVFGK